MSCDDVSDIGNQITAVVDGLVFNHARWLETKLREAIEYRLGPSVDVESLRGRLIREEYPDNPLRFYCLDDRVLLVVTDPEPVVVDDKPMYTLRYWAPHEDQQVEQTQ